MYWKRKMTTTPRVDVEELKRQLKTELLGDMKPILEAQGVQFTNIAGVMSEKEHRSSLASTAGGGWPQGEIQVPASRPADGHEQPLPSFELDTIDNLAQPIACSHILLIGGSFWMEVRTGLVYPHHTIFDDIQIDTSSYVVVKVDKVHENLKDLKLEMSPDDTTLTLWDTVTRVQWRRTSIDGDPSVVASASNIASQPNTAPASIFPETRPSPSPIWE
jgi:hypothetical protein